MAVRFQLRRDTAATWTSTNPVLALGEPGVETDTLKVKVGDGVTAWNSLGYSITKDFTDLTSKPTTIAGYGITDAVASSSVSVFGASLIDDADATTARTTLGLGTAATTAATAYATAAQGSTADTAVQPGDIGTAAAQSVSYFATAAQGSTADTAVQPGDNIQTSIIDSSDSSAITITPDVVMSAGLTVGNHIVPSSNENIDLGSATNRFKELFLSGNTIDLGGALIKRVAGNTVELPVGSNIGGKNIAATDQELNTTDAVTFANITTSGYLRGPASFVIDPAAFGDDTGTVVIAGNLQVDGTTTTINSTTVAIDDLNFSIATDAADSAAANGAGISIGGAGATLNYTHATTSWDMNKPLNVTGDIGVSGTVDGVDIAARDAILTSTTSALSSKQDGLVSGTSIKTINSTSLLGSGDVAVQASLVSGTNIKTVNSTSLLGSGDVAVQASLVSGTNIKTINGGSVLGGGNLTVGAQNDVFYENSQTVSTSYTITSGKNAMTAGPVTLDTGVTVEIPSGSRWVIV